MATIVLPGEPVSPVRSLDADCGNWVFRNSCPMQIAINGRPATPVWMQAALNGISHRGRRPDCGTRCRLGPGDGVCGADHTEGSHDQRSGAGDPDQVDPAQQLPATQDGQSTDRPQSQRPTDSDGERVVVAGG